MSKRKVYGNSQLAMLGSIAAKPLVEAALQHANTVAEMERVATEFGYSPSIALEAWMLAGHAAVERPDVGCAWIVHRAKAVLLALI